MVDSVSRAPRYQLQGSRLNRLKPLVATCAMICALVTGPGTAAPIGAVNYTLLLDTTAAIPDGVGTFSLIGLPTRGPGDVVAFEGVGANGQGLYAISGGSVERIVDTSNSISDTGQNFFGFQCASGGRPCFAVGSGVAAFWATFAGSGFPGAFLANSTGFTSIARAFEPLPGGGTVRQVDGIPILRGDDVILSIAALSSGTGLYAGTPAGLELLVGTSTPLPGTMSTFTRLDPFQVVGDGDSIAFPGFGSGGERGMFVLRNSVVETVAGPGLFGPTGSAFSVTAGGGSIAFDLRGAGPVVSGKYLWQDNVLTQVLRFGDPVPGSEATFVDFDGQSVFGNRILFAGRASGFGGATGLFTLSNGTVEALINVGDVLDGATVYSLGIWRDALSADSFVFLAELDDGRSGIYRAEFAVVPVPSALWLFAAALAALAAFRRPTG